MRKSFSKHTKGMTLVEVLVTLSIFIVITIAVGAFEANTFTVKNSVSSSYQTAQNAQVILKTILTQLREMQQGADGSYPLISASTSTISFYSDSDNNNVAEQVSYTLMGNTLYRASILPSGNPPVYNGANRSTTTIMVGVRNSSSTPIFEYFDTNYAGTSSPLTLPLTTTAVRLVKINLTLDLDPNRSPLPVTYTVQASLRNLKTNL